MKFRLATYISHNVIQLNLNYFFDPTQARITAGLKELRNKSVFFFSVFNALFVLIIFMLTLHKDTLYINWPLGVRENITYTDDDQVLLKGKISEIPIFYFPTLKNPGA